jgi:hypothetical protein
MQTRRVPAWDACSGALSERRSEEIERLAYLLSWDGRAGLTRAGARFQGGSRCGKGSPPDRHGTHARQDVSACVAPKKIRICAILGATLVVIGTAMEIVSVWPSTDVDAEQTTPD